MITYLLPILIGYTGGKMATVTTTSAAAWSVRSPLRRDHRRRRPDVPRRDDHGPARRLVDEAARRPLGRQDQARLRDAGQQLLRRHLGRDPGDRRLLRCSRPVLGPGRRAGSATASTSWSTTTCCRSPRSSSSRRRCCSSTTRINHGVLTPLGIAEAAEQGKSILFLLEANPGPGLGLLLAYTHLRQGPRQGLGPGCGDHPVLRRHPRDLLPVRADEAEDDPRDDRRRHDRHPHPT